MPANNMNSYDDRIYGKSVESRYIHCPVCGSKDYQMRICGKCGYDSALDYTRFLTLDLLEKGSRNPYRSYDALYKDAEYEKLKQEIAELKKSQNRVNEKQRLLEEKMQLQLNESQSSLAAQLNRCIKEIEDLKSEAVQKKAEEKARTSKFANVTVGSTIKYGNYRQSADGKRKSPIEWLVLEKEKDRILVISKNILDIKPWNTKYDESVTWKTCSLREWLNDDSDEGFYGQAFTEAEKMQIELTEDETGSKEKVFLLSVEEVEDLFESDEDRVSRITGYASAHLQDMGWDLEEGEDWPWWLRSVGSEGGRAAFVYNDGDVDSLGISVGNDSSGVRPALYISLAS